MHPDNIQEDKARIVEILYLNYRGELRTYGVIPHSMWFGKTEFHPEEQWMMKATDVDRNVVRDFAMKDIKEWKF